MENKIRVRVAKIEDIPDISEIGVYVLSNGFKSDYLPTVIQKWFTDKNRIMIVVEYDGKVVGFESMILLDEGKTVFLEAIRGNQN